MRLGVPQYLLKAALWIFVGGLLQTLRPDVYVIAINSLRALATAVEASAQLLL